MKRSKLLVFLALCIIGWAAVLLMIQGFIDLVEALR